MHTSAKLARLAGMGGCVIGMKTFGASAPLKELQKKFGFEPDQVAAAAKELPAESETSHEHLRHASLKELAWSYNLLQTGEGPIEVVSRANQRQMGECLGKIPEMFTARTEFLRIKTEVIGVTDRLFEKEACLL